MRGFEHISSRSDLLRWSLRECRGVILFAAAIGLAVNALQLSVPIYMMQVYDRVITSHSLDTLWMLTLLAGALLAFMALLDYTRAKAFILLGERFIRRLGPTVLQAAVSDALQAPGGPNRSAMRDLQEIRQFIASGPINLPFDAAFAPFLLLVILVLHPVYALVALAGIAALSILSYAMERLARRPSAAAADAAAQSQNEIVNAIRHAEVIEAMGMVGHIAQRWQRAQSRLLALSGDANYAARAIGAATRAARMALQIAMLAAGAALVISHEASAGSMMAASLLLARLLLPFEQAIDGWRQWSNAGAAIGRLRRLLAGQDEARGNSAFAAHSSALSVERLSFIAPGEERPILRGVNFALQPGEILGVIGQSGAGKSTLARLLVGIWRPTTGGVYLDGHNVFAWERESFGREVGYLPQSAGLLDGTVRENICRFDRSEPAAAILAAKRADVHEMIGRLPHGYDTRVGADAFALSGGQRQRLALARALYGSPKLVVLDEPNASLDAQGESALRRSLIELKAQGTTVIVIAHRMSVMNIADKLLLLKDGQVEQFGAREDVMAALARQDLPGGGDRKVAHLALERGKAR